MHILRLTGIGSGRDRAVNVTAVCLQKPLSLLLIQRQQTHRSLLCQLTDGFHGKAHRAEESINLSTLQRLCCLLVSVIANLQQRCTQTAALQNLFCIQLCTGFDFTQRHHFSGQILYRLNVRICPHYDLTILRIQAGHSTVAGSGCTFESALTIPGICRHIGLGNGQIQIAFRQQADVGSRTGRLLDIKLKARFFSDDIRRSHTVSIIRTAFTGSTEPNLRASAAADESCREQQCSQQDRSKCFVFHIHSSSLFFMLFLTLF